MQGRSEHGEKKELQETEGYTNEWLYEGWWKGRGIERARERERG